MAGSKRKRKSEQFPWNIFLAQKKKRFVVFVHIYSWMKWHKTQKAR